MNELKHQLCLEDGLQDCNALLYDRVARVQPLHACFPKLFWDKHQAFFFKLAFLL